MAGAGLSGDFAGLSELIDKMSSLGSPSILSELSRVLGEEAKTQVLLGFEQSRDPYGDPWKPVHRGGKPLRDTGRLFNSWVVTSSARGFRVGTGVEYAGTHQTGKTIKAKQAGHPMKFKVGPRGAGGWRSMYKVTIPKRQMLPDRQRGLGPIWGPALSLAGERYARRLFGNLGA